MSELNAPATSPPPAAVSKIAVYEVHTADLARLTHYYQDALGFVLTGESADASYLTTGSDHHCVAIRAGEPNGRAGLGFTIHGSLQETAQRLRAAGIEFERRSDPQPAIAEALILAEPGSGTPLMLFESQGSSGVASGVGLRPTKLGHVASYVPDLLSIQRFYIDALGFRWSDTIGDFFTFLRCNADHHAINLLQSADLTGLFHVAYEVRDFTHLKDNLDHLAGRGYKLEWGPGRHGVGHNIFSYHRDPDGNLVELFTEIDVIFDEENPRFEPRPWHESWPQGPQVWEPSPITANKWGILNPELAAD